MTGGGRPCRRSGGKQRVAAGNPWSPYPSPGQSQGHAFLRTQESRGRNCAAIAGHASQKDTSHWRRTRCSEKSRAAVCSRVR